MTSIKDKYAIAGIGHTGFSLESNRSELHLALEAVMAAVEDAGLDFNDIDGIVGDYPCKVDTMTIASALGMREFGFFIETDFAGGGVPSGLLHAALGIESGRASHVVCYKALNGASKLSGPTMDFATEPYESGFTWPFGLLHPVAAAALAARRHMHEYGTRTRQFGAIAATCRKHANCNPDALMAHEPMTLEDHRQS